MKIPTELKQISRTRICIFVIIMLLLGGMFYSVTRSNSSAKYPDSAGDFLVKLDYSYYQIWFDKVEVFAMFSESESDKPEPFNGTYTVLLLDTLQTPTSFLYDATRIVDGHWYDNNSLSVRYNTTISVKTSTIKNVATIGDSFSLDIQIICGDDLIFEYWPLYYSTDLPKLHLAKGELNNVSTTILFSQDESPNLISSYWTMKCREGSFDYTLHSSYGFFPVLLFDIYKETPSGEHYLDTIDHSIFLLPYSCNIVEERKVDVEDGKIWTDFPLGTSLSANKIAFIRSLHTESYIIELNPLVIWLSPPITFLLPLLLGLSYWIYRRRTGVALHLFKYKILYSCTVIVIVLLLSLPIAAADIIGSINFGFIVCIMFVGLMSAGVEKGSLLGSERGRFWKTTVVAMFLLSSLFMIWWAYLYVWIAPHNPRAMVYALLYFEIPILLFLGSCTLGMIMNSAMSYVAGLFLLLCHILLRIWNRIQRKLRIPPMKVKDESSSSVKASAVETFSHYAFELFISSIWFVMLIASSISVNIENIWETLWDTNIIFFMIPFWSFILLCFQFELLKVRWKKYVVSSIFLRKIWSIFAICVFAVKILSASVDATALTGLLLMFYFFLVASTGFAAGFVGTSRTSLKRALKEIVRIGNRYKGFQIG